MKEGLRVSGDGVFYTLQGEGVSIGEPVTFLRLNFCNLSCVYCDTPYTWGKDAINEQEIWSVKETAEKVRANWGSVNQEKPKRLVITGGEPLVQKGKIDDLMDELPDWKFEIETNGTIMPTDKQLTNAQINCSPKLENSGNPREVRIKPDVLKAINKVGGYFKFVVSKPEDVGEMEKDFIEPCGLNKDHVILMPMGIDIETLREHSQNVVEIAKEKGYRLIGRMQIDLWGNERRT